MKTLVATLAALLVSSMVQAQPADYRHDLAGCRYANGASMDSVECEAMRKYFAEKEASKAKRDREAALNQAAYEAERQTAEEARRAKIAAMQAAREQESQRQSAQLARVREKIDAEERAEERLAQKATAARKAQCGPDYKAPRIGMSIDRAQQCVAAMRITGQINRADGVLTTYQTNTGAFFHVMDGRIVAWGR